MRTFWMGLAGLLLGACGVADVGTATATNAKLQAEQARQGKETMDKMQRDVEAAARAQQERARQEDK